MKNYLTSSNIYRVFGVEKYAGELAGGGKKSKLKQLDRILSKYILSKAIDDLSEENLKKLEGEKIKDSQELFIFLAKHIDNFSDKLIEYGRNFRRDFATTGIVS